MTRVLPYDSLTDPVTTLTWCPVQRIGKSDPPRIERWAVLQTPAHPLVLLATKDGIAEADFADNPEQWMETWRQNHPDQHPEPALPPNSLAPIGTPFQIDVWRILLTIPSGETRTYGWIARRMGHPTAVRAVGSAVGKNPIPCLIPCHRVLPANGSVGNYSGGVEKKVALLQHEDVTLPLKEMEILS